MPRPGRSNSPSIGSTEPSGHAYARFHKARLLEGLGRVDEARAELRLGLEAARVAGDAKALSEIAGALEALGG
ncbi:MAG: hypothetical protein ACYTFH_09165 [Planctomycetota bacterium]|jgi:hypothetical protein